ncbi:MAG: hypothetical protein M3Q31_25965 [Actinomycetota bacterium]|nr:hypothetical protein [Actinomycetota bacterium]
MIAGREQSLFDPIPENEGPLTDEVRRGIDAPGVIRRHDVSAVSGILRDRDSAAGAFPSQLFPVVDAAVEHQRT